MNAIEAEMSIPSDSDTAFTDGLPAYEKHVVVRAGGAKVRVDALTTDILYVTNEAMGYWAHPEYGALT